MKLRVASTPYLRGLSTFYEDWFQSVPSHMRVTRVIKVKERVYPHHDQVLHDYLICFGDGTCDPVSVSPIQGPPEVGQQFNRLTAGAGDFVTWSPTAEEITQINRDNS